VLVGDSLEYFLHKIKLSFAEDLVGEGEALLNVLFGDSGSCVVVM
jgi:hypothetical protein